MENVRTCGMGALITKANKLNPEFEMGSQIYDKVLIRILLNHPLPSRLSLASLHVCFNVDGRVDMRELLKKEQNNKKT